MIKYKTIFLVFFFLYYIPSFSQSNNTFLYTAIVSLGERNLELNENHYQNLNFYYTPKLEIIRDSNNKLLIKGKPKILEEWNAKQDLQFHAILFDSKANGAWEGTLENGKDFSQILGFNGLSFQEALEKYVIKKEAVEETEREFIIYSANSIYRGKYYQCPFAERKMVPFYIYDKASNAYLITELIDRKKPILLIFYYYENSTLLTNELPINEINNKIQRNKKQSILNLIKKLDNTLLKYNKL